MLNWIHIEHDIPIITGNRQLNEKYLSLLRNPLNGERIDMVETPDGIFLVGRDSRMLFPVREGIPVFIEPSKLTDANEKSRRYYDILAPFYQFTQSVYYWFKGGEARARNEYLQYVGVKDGDRVLEVSIGNGVNIESLPRGAEYFGIDVSWGQLKRCRELGSKSGIYIELFQAEAEHLPFCDEAFDVVFNVASINYFEDKRKAIDEMFRVAKPGARMMIADETEKAAHAHNRLPIYRGFFNGSKAPVVPPVHLLPENAVDVKLTEIRNGLYFVLEFKKAS